MAYHPNVSLREPSSIGVIINYVPRDWGTREEFLLLLCLELRRYRPVVLVCSEPPPEAMRLRYETANIAVESVPLERFSLKAYNDLKRIVRKHSISVAYLRFFHATQHCFWMARFAGISDIVYAQATSGELTTNFWRLFLQSLKVRLLLHPVTRVIAISQAVAKNFHKLGISSSKVVVVYNGIDLSRFRPDASSAARLRTTYTIPDGDFIVSSASFLLHRKHPHILINAIALLNQRGIRSTLVIAGDGPLKEPLEALAKELGVSEKVRLLPYTHTPEMIMQGCHVFALASIGEAFGYVLAEAMACGCPVVGSDSGGIPEVVAHGQTGIVVKPGDPTAFADAFEKLSSDEELRLRMGENARKRVVELFQVDMTVRRTVEVVLQVNPQLSQMPVSHSKVAPDV